VITPTTRTQHPILQHGINSNLPSHPLEPTIPSPQDLHPINSNLHTQVIARDRYGNTTYWSEGQNVNVEARGPEFIAFSVTGRGLHSFPFQLNLSSSISRIPQLIS
jgi:hypothetical protein